uniref:50S ribosomal protein L20 n=1 Tax=Nephromyces sp. ex Molgula occidentalis TaxID=2544991 RepID=A0A5C1H8E6_9APIC|nr:hypothetical protein [Nephromyces sp. ex Molgula occidentalis]
MISFYKLKNKQSKQKYLKAGKLSYKHRKKFLSFNSTNNISKINKLLKIRKSNYSNFKSKLHYLNILLNKKFQFLLLEPVIFNLLFTINKDNKKSNLNSIFNLINFYI